LAVIVHTHCDIRGTLLPILRPPHAMRPAAAGPQRKARTKTVRRRFADIYTALAYPIHRPPD
jgi:hypothetical protein